MNRYSGILKDLGSSKRATKSKPLPLVRHPTHLRLLGRDKSGLTPILSQHNPVSTLRTPPGRLPSTVSQPVTRDGSASKNRYSTRAFRNVGNNQFAPPKAHSPIVSPTNSVRPILFTQAGFENASGSETRILPARRNSQQLQSTVRPASSTSSGVGEPQARGSWGNVGRIFEEFLGISSAQAQAGPNNPNFAAKARKEFLKLNPKWIAGKEYYVKNPFTRQLVKFVPDVLRLTNRSGDNFLEYHAGELKAGRQSNRKRIVEQMLKYKWAKAGIYDRNGKRRGRVAKTTYFHQGNRKQLSQQSKSFRSAVIRHGHSFHLLSGKPKATNSVGNVPPKSASTKAANNTLQPKAPPHSGRSHGGGGGAFGVFKYNPFRGRYNHLTYIPFL